MIVSELIAALRKLPPDAEVGIFSATAHARPIMIQRVEPLAWVSTGRNGGWRNPSNAYLLRPSRDVIGGREDLLKGGQPCT